MATSSRAERTRSSWLAAVTTRLSTTCSSPSDLMAGAAELLNGIWYGKSPLRYALWPVSAVYRGLARLRRTAYQRGWRPTVEVPVPVIVVGNVSAGGTGKTP